MKPKQTIIVVTAYGEDNYFQKRYEDVVGLFTSVESAIKGAKADGMTNKQKDYLERINAFRCIRVALLDHIDGMAFQVEYEEETDKRFKPCTSSYMFNTYNVY